MGRKQGITEDQLLDLNHYATSPHFSEREKVALELVDAITREPADLSDDLFARLNKQYSYPELVELAAAAAFENYRARFNRVFNIGSAEFTEGAGCALPAHRGPS